METQQSYSMGLVYCAAIETANESSNKMAKKLKKIISNYNNNFL